MSTPGQVPVYYPPPPRVPLFRPETKYYIGRIFLGILFGGAIIGLLVGVISILSRVLTSGPAVVSSPKPSPGATTGENKAKIDPVTDAEGGDKALSAKYEQQAYDLMNQGRRTDAEQSLLSAADVDKNNPQIQEVLAQWYQDDADAATSPETKILKLVQSGDHWAGAAEYEVSASKSQEVQIKAKAAYIQAAQIQGDSDHAKARQILVDARKGISLPDLLKGLDLEGEKYR